MPYHSKNTREHEESQENYNLVDKIFVTNNSSIHPQLPKFMGKNFDNRCIQMLVLFTSQDLHLVNNGYIDVTNSKEFEALPNEQKDSFKEHREKDQHALFAMFQAVNKSIFEKMLQAKMAKEACVTLQKLYKGDDRVKRMKLQTLRSEFKSLCMNDSDLY